MLWHQHQHVHFHVCVVDGVFEEAPGDADADADAKASTPGIKEMLAYQHSGFSVDAGVCIEAHDRAAPGALTERYCAGPPFAMDRLRQAGATLVYRCDEVFALLCPMCGGQMRLIAFITEGLQIRRVLEPHRGGF